MSKHPFVPHDVELLASELVALRESLSEAGPAVGKLLESALLDPAHDILSRRGKGFRWRMVEHGWALLGDPKRELSKLLPTAVELLHVGSLIIDDIEDDSSSRRGQPTLHRRYGVPLALNTGNWLYFLAMSCLSRLPCDDGCRLALMEEVTSTLMRCHEGQALDISVVVTSLPMVDVAEVVSRTTTMKTGGFMALAASVGARYAGGTDEDVEWVRAFGSQVGVGLQMLDDWSGIHNEKRRHKGLEDLRLARPIWPWAWLAEHTDQLTYADLVRRARRASTDWELDRVRERMETLLSPIAPKLIETQLGSAMSFLRSKVDDVAAVEALESELEALVEAYG